jgi:hypothetical protein
LRDFDFIISNAYAADVLRKVFGMGYRKVKKRAFQGNSKRSLVLRQQCALRMFPILNSDTVIVNLDESFLNDADGRHKKWRVRNQANTVTEKAIAPRLNMFSAIDTQGRSYFSITYENTDDTVFCLFMQKLVAKIKAERPDFRKNTVFQFDGASPHLSEKTKQFL